MRLQEPTNADEKSDVCSGASSDTESFHHMDIDTSISSSVNENLHSSKISFCSTEDVSNASSGQLYFSLDGASAAPLCCDDVRTQEVTSETVDSMQQQAQQPSHQPAAYILSWPTTRRKNMASPNGKLPISSTTRVNLARSFTNVANTSEFVV
jgi:hypothetical protein